MPDENYNPIFCNTQPQSARAILRILGPMLALARWRGDYAIRRALIELACCWRGVGR